MEEACLQPSRLVAGKPVGKGTPFPQDDDGIDGYPGNFLHGDGKDGPEFGYEACSTSPAALEYEMNYGVCFDQAVSNAIYNAADPLPTRAGKWQGSGMAPTLVGTATSPPKQVSSSLRSTGFAPVILKPPHIGRCS